MIQTLVSIALPLIFIGSQTSRIETLLPVLEEKESNCREDAIGDNGKAIGCLQIHKIVVDDVNLILGKETYNYNDRFSREKSYQMARIYLNHYGKNKGYESLARIWNGGPRGDKKTSTITYWQDVKQLLENRGE